VSNELKLGDIPEVSDTSNNSFYWLRKTGYNVPILRKAPNINDNTRALLSLVQHLDNALNDASVACSPEIRNVINRVQHETLQYIHDAALCSLSAQEFTECIAKALSKPHISISNQKNAIKPRKDYGVNGKAKEVAKRLFDEWCVNPELYKNKAGFVEKLEERELCSRRNAYDWLDQFKDEILVSKDRDGVEGVESQIPEALLRKLKKTNKK